VVRASPLLLWYGFLSAPVSLSKLTLSPSQIAVARGDLTQKITGISVSDGMLNLFNIINDMIDRLAIFDKEFKRVAPKVGTKGKLRVQVEGGNVQDSW
jgi:osomolarity two-component system sensor histidine kinase NIK1